MIKNLKKIYCFGTSFTAGGGFEFNHLILHHVYEKYYKKTNLNLNQETFSYPGQLQNLIGSDIEVINLSKNGYGNERIYRLLFDITNDKKFKKDECLFLIEFSDIGRKEYYFNPIGDYVINNYNENLDYFSIGHTYLHDSFDTQEIINKNTKIIKDFHKLTFNYDEKIKEIQRNNIFLITYLEFYNINYWFTNKPIFDDPILYEKFYPSDELGKSIFFGNKNYHSMINYFSDGLTIKDETNGEINDFHSGLVGNYNIAVSIYNKLLNENIIRGNIIEFKNHLKDFYI